MNDHAFLPSKDGDDASYAWLDEWLCEYVDGTMDPSLKANFETYIEANPELKAHIEQLNETRDLLGQRGGPGPPSKEKRERVCRRVRSKVCRKVECDMLRSQESIGSLLQDHSRAALGIASSMAVALVVGIFTGALLFGSSDPFESSSPVAASAPSGTIFVFPERLVQRSHRLGTVHSCSYTRGDLNDPLAGSCIVGEQLGGFVVVASLECPSRPPTVADLRRCAHGPRPFGARI